MGAGGLQAMVKCGLPIRGKRVIVAGTGPLLLAVAAYLRKHGAEIPVICEQASWSELGEIRLGAASVAGKDHPGVPVANEISLGVPFAANSWPLAAHGQQALESVNHLRAGRVENYPLRLSRLRFSSGSRTSNCRCCWGVRSTMVASRSMTFRKRPSHQSFVPANRPASEAWSWRSSKVRLPAWLRPDARPKRRALFGKRQKARRFAQLLDRTFRLRSELRSLPLSETMVCRCEDVSYSRLRQHTLVARRQAAHALRYGSLPGTSVRPRHAISFQVESGFGSAARFPRPR